jgi:hypothetical protein
MKRIIPKVNGIVFIGPLKPVISKPFNDLYIQHPLKALRSLALTETSFSTPPNAQSGLQDESQGNRPV